MSPLLGLLRLLRRIRETRLDVVKAGLHHFVRHKSRLSSKHRFGVCMLAGEASWVLDFTSEIDIVLATINSLQVVPGLKPFRAVRVRQTHGFADAGKGRRERLCKLPKYVPSNSLALLYPPVS